MGSCIRTLDVERAQLVRLVHTTGSDRLVRYAGLDYVAHRVKDFNRAAVTLGSRSPNLLDPTA
jgi:hypothetical protein